MFTRAETTADLPGALPIFPLSGGLLLPHTNRPLNIFEQRFIAMVDDALGSDRLIGLVQPRDTAEEAPRGRVPLREIGCLGRITHFEETEDERYLIVLHGVCRFNLGRELIGTAPYRRFEIDAGPFAADFSTLSGEQGVDRARFVSAMRSYADFAGIEVDWDEVEQTETADLVNLCSMLGPYGAAEKQVLLEAPSLVARAETLIALAEMEMARSKSGHVLQ